MRSQRREHEIHRPEPQQRQQLLLLCGFQREQNECFPAIVFREFKKRLRLLTDILRQTENCQMGRGGAEVAQEH